MKKASLVLVLAMLIINIPFIVSAQAPDTLWTKIYGGSGNDVADFVEKTTDGGYIILGFTDSYGAGDYDFWLVKTDEYGNEEWNHTYGGGDNEATNGDVQQTTDGGYIFSGWTDSYGSGNHDFWLVKTDEYGNEEWNHTYGGWNSDFPFLTQQTTDGGYFLAGHTDSYGAGGYDFWLVKTDEYGNEEWNHTYGGDNNEEIYSAQQTIDGGYILVGYTQSYGVGGYDFWLVKTDEYGNEEWNHTYGGSEADRAYCVQQNIDASYIIAGRTMSYGAGNNDMWLIKLESPDYGDIDDNGEVESYDASLILQYKVDLDPLPEDPVPWEDWRMERVDVDLDSHVYALDVAYILQYVLGIRDILPVLDGARNFVVFSLSNDDEYIYLSCEESIIDLEYVITDYHGLELGIAQAIEGCTYYQNDQHLILISPQGISGEILKIPYQAYSSSANLVMEIQSGSHFQQISYQLSDPAITLSRLNSIYPNPFNLSTTISYQLGEEEKVNITIYNIKGQKVKVLLNERQEKGEHTLNWDARDLPSGLYLYQMRSGKYMFNGKMILMK